MYNMNDMNAMNMNYMDDMNSMLMNSMQNSQIQTQMGQSMLMNLMNQNQQCKPFVDGMLGKKRAKIIQIKQIDKKKFNSEFFLLRFFELILVNSKKAHILDYSDGNDTIDINKNAIKFYVNYYDIIKAEVYADINSKINEIIRQIFAQIFYPYLVKKINKRTNQKQTTEFIILNPFNDIYDELIPFIYQNFLYFEFKGKNLSQSLELTGKAFGLNENDELSLKLISEFEKEIKELPKNYVPISISIDDKFFGNFYPSIKGITYGKFMKIINNSNYYMYYENFNKICYSTLKLSKRGNIIGGGDGIYDGYLFIDPSDSSIKQIELSKNAPNWRILSKGLNLFGICQNKNCQAYKKEVVFKTNQKGHLPKEGMIFDMIESSNKIKCPICDKIFIPNTCGFYKCEYQFIGEKLENGDEIHYDSKTRETKGNKIEYYQPKKGKEAKWFKLKIYVLPIQEIKYKP